MSCMYIFNDARNICVSLTDLYCDLSVCVRVKFFIPTYRSSKKCATGGFTC